MKNYGKEGRGKFDKCEMKRGESEIVITHTFMDRSIDSENRGNELNK